MAQFHRRELTV